MTEFSELQKQYLAFGKGFVAFLCKCPVRDTVKEGSPCTCPFALTLDKKCSGYKGR